jgi:Uma2 family endonuclease
MTLRCEEKERGLEADECYCRDRDGEVPELALEVIISSPLLDKLEVYRGLGVREVWIYRGGGFEVQALRGERYERIGASEIFPEVELAVIARYAAMPDQHAALRAFRDELRGR